LSISIDLSTPNVEMCGDWNISYEDTTTVLKRLLFVCNLSMRVDILAQLGYCDDIEA
jgi:hypothetical protein